MSSFLVKSSRSFIVLKDFAHILSLENCEPQGKPKPKPMPKPPKGPPPKHLWSAQGPGRKRKVSAGDLDVFMGFSLE